MSDKRVSNCMPHLNVQCIYFCLSGWSIGWAGGKNGGWAGGEGGGWAGGGSSGWAGVSGGWTSSSSN